MIFSGRTQNRSCGLMVGSGVVHKLKEEVNREATKHMVREKADSV